MGVGSLKRFLIASAVLHALVVTGGVLFHSKHPAKKLTQPPVWITLDTLSSPKKAPESEDQKHNRIVQTRKGRVVQEAPRDAFFGERNQVVDEQTASKVSKPSLAQQAPSQKTKSSGSAESSARNQKNSSTGAPSLSQLGIALNRPSLKDTQEPTSNPADRGASDWMMGAKAEIPQEYIQGLKPGEATALNTREHQFFGYFQRIRSRLDIAWEGTLRHELMKFYRMGRALASDKEHTTRVLVTLNLKGEITRVEILEESGTRDLDQAAIRAFNQAGPFPNPPKGILDRNKQVQLRWDFVLRS